MKLIFSILAFSLVLFACDSVKQKTKEAINDGGEVAGKTATEFIEGVTEGVDRSLDCSLSLSHTLQDKGLKTGKFTINNDTLGGENNLLTVYLIFDKDFKENVLVKAFDKKDFEMGRSKLLIEGKAGEAKFFDFHFDKRTNIEVKSKLNFE